MKKLITTGLLLSLLTVSTVVAASNNKTNNHLSLLVANDSSIEIEEQETIKKLKSKYFTIVTKDTEIETNIHQLDLDLKVSTEETRANKLSNYASFITKQKNYTYSVNLQDPSLIESKILQKLNLPNQPKEPSLQYIDNEFQLDKGSIGYKVENITDVASDIEASLQSNTQNSISVILRETQPSVSDEELLRQKDSIVSFETFNTTLQTDNRFQKDIAISNTDLSLDASQDLKISDLYLEELLSELKPRLEQEKQDFIIEDIDTDSKDIQTKGDLLNGISINTELLKTNIENSIQNRSAITALPLKIEEASIINNHNNQEYSLLGSGISNYAGSGAGRVHNIQFASDERYKTIYVPQGETFKFNSYLGGPVTISRGWATAYVISGGKIVPAPGGGICQMSTTFYRAALESGLQIDRKSNHSLYVDYYSAYGDGLDAAIFPGSKDLHFTNNTPGDIILHSYYNADTQDLTVNILGQDDGRTTELFGPFTAGNNENNPFELSTRTNQINWVRQITKPNGELDQETFTSTYSRFYRY